jgi:hypothetical protein
MGNPFVSCARATRGLRKPSPGLLARLGVPVGGRVRKSRAVGDQSGHPFGKMTSRIGRNIAGAAPRRVHIDHH